MYKFSLIIPSGIYLFLVILLGCIALSFCPSPTIAGDWQVIPIRLDFDQRARSGVITVRNDGEKKLTIHVDAKEWLQDETGKDIYQPTDDLIFFPKKLIINPKEERVIRAGIKVPAVNQEKTYRLFLREVPEKNSKNNNAVVIAIQFATPIFSKPIEEEIRGEIASIKLIESQLHIHVLNTGNTHFRINSLEVTGQAETNERLFFKKISGWYLLADTERTYSASIPEGTCHKLKTLGIQINADRIDLHSQINVDPSMCEIY